MNCEPVNRVGASLVSYRYSPEVLEALADHGLCPRSDTPPARVREALSDLYRYEIRRLKRQLLEGQFPKAEYSGLVLRLRKRYGLLSVPVALWAKPAEQEGQHQKRGQPPFLRKKGDNQE